MVAVKRCWSGRESGGNLSPVITPTQKARRLTSNRELCAAVSAGNWVVPQKRKGPRKVSNADQMLLLALEEAEQRDAEVPRHWVNDRGLQGSQRGQARTGLP